MTPEKRTLAIAVAMAYVNDRDATYASVARKFDISSTTVGTLLEKVELIDKRLWKRVKAKKVKNMTKSHQNFTRLYKKSLIEKILDFFRK